MSCIKDFEVLSTLGSGSFSSVYKVKRISDGQEYALKKVKLPALSHKEKENALNEIRILASISDRNIVAYKDAFYDEGSSCLCIIMELASGGDLLKIIGEHKKKGIRVPEDTVWSYLIQMTQGLKTLHGMKILHRDLKGANVFLAADGVTLKLGDLNVSKIAQKGLVYTQAGTPYYASPEIWQDKPYNLKSDIWSLGCVIYELCASVPPFRANDMRGLVQKVNKGVYEKIPSVYSKDLAAVIQLCLNVSPEKRPDTEKLLTLNYIVARMTSADIENMKKAPLFVHDLLDTIKLPRNIKQLASVLPKANYNKKKSPASLCDLDQIVEEEVSKPYAPYPRPDSRQRRVLGNVQHNPSNISVDLGYKKDNRDYSVDRDVRGREAQRNIQQVAPKGTSVPPKLTPIQRAAKAVVIMDIFRGRPNERPPMVPLKADDITIDEYMKPPVMSKPNSRQGYRNVEIMNQVRPIGNYGRSNTPNPSSRKISEDCILPSIFQNNVNSRAPSNKQEPYYLQNRGRVMRAIY